MDGRVAWRRAWLAAALSVALTGACEKAGTVAERAAAARAGREILAQWAVAVSPVRKPLQRVRAIEAASRRVREDTAHWLRALLRDHEPRVAGAAKISLRRVQGKSSLSFARTMVVGASVSAGFLGTPVATLLDDAIRDEHEVENLATLAFARAPEQRGREQVDTTIAYQPTVVVAIDFLFWYVYTADLDLHGRLARLEQALAELERIHCPIILGDIPDMRAAQSWILAPESVPPAEHLAEINRRVRDWARDKVHVHVVPLSEWARPLLTGEPVEDRGALVDPRDMVSVDSLHLNPTGSRYLVRKVCAELGDAFPDTPPGALRAIP